MKRETEITVNGVTYVRVANLHGGNISLADDCSECAIPPECRIGDDKSPCRINVQCCPIGYYYKYKTIVDEVIGKL